MTDELSTLRRYLRRLRIPVSGYVTPEHAELGAKPGVLVAVWLKSLSERDVQFLIYRLKARCLPT